MSLPAAPFLYPLTDARAGGAPPSELAAEAAGAGAPLVQLRDKELPDGVFLAEARRALAAVRACGARLIVNDRLDVALLAGADGLHLGDEDLPAAEARRLLGAGPLIGVSTHSEEEALRRAEEPVDYLAIGPIYATALKPRRTPLGPDVLRRVRVRVGKPLVAIGGITAQRLCEVLEAGADGIAVVGAVMVPGEVARRTRELLGLLAPGGRGRAGR